MSHFVRMFKPQFAALVESNQKRQTIRPVPKRMPKAGDIQSNRVWTGRPYNSKQRILNEVVIKGVESVVVSGSGVNLNGALLEHPDKFAQLDGFKDWAAMRDWFEREHGFPFIGIVIYW